jgi:hypothetical protein
MPKRTIILILVLILVTAGLVWLSVYTVPQEKTPIVEKETTMDYAKTTITLSSTPSAISQIPLVYSLDTQISTEDNKITGAQLEISYDPKAITNVDILPGSFFTDPVILLKNIDEKNGRISFAIGTKMGQKPVSGKGVLAKLQFTSTPQSSITATTIDFLPKTMVAGGEKKSVLKSALGTIVKLEESTPSE